MINSQFPKSVITLFISVLKAIFKIGVINFQSHSNQALVSKVHLGEEEKKKKKKKKKTETVAQGKNKAAANFFIKLYWKQ